MFWRPFNFVSAMSLVLVVVLAGLCGWSYHRTDVMGYVNSNTGRGKCTEICLASSRGQLSLLTVIDSTPVLTSEPGKLGWQVSDSERARVNFGVMGFSASRQWSIPERNGIVVVGAPYWFLIVLAVALPAWWSHRRRRKLARQQRA